MDNDCQTESGAEPAVMTAALAAVAAIKSKKKAFSFFFSQSRMQRTARGNPVAAHEYVAHNSAHLCRQDQGGRGG